MPFVFDLVRFHTHGAMDSINLIDLPAFRIAEGNQPKDAEGNPTGAKEPDTLYVFDHTRLESVYVKAHPGTEKGQYTPVNG